MTSAPLSEFERRMHAADRRLSARLLGEATIQRSSDYAIKGVFERGTLAVVYGAPGAGKSFFVSDAALHVAAGEAWRDHRVRRGAVLYLAGEAPRSIEMRAIAWCDHYGNRGLPFAICGDPVNLRNPADADRVVELARQVASDTGEAIAVVVVDTVARAYAGGDENNAGEMGQLVACLDTIKAGTGACVIAVHHAGKDATRGARGSNALEAAVDTVIKVDNKTAVLEKARDGEVGAAFPFALRVIQLGDDEDGDPLTTCIVEHDSAQAQRRGGRPERLSNAERLALSALEAALSDEARRRLAPPDLHNHGAKVGQYVVTLDDWRAAFYARIGYDTNAETKRKQFQRAREGLQAKGRAFIHEETAWIG